MTNDPWLDAVKIEVSREAHMVESVSSWGGGLSKLNVLTFGIGKIWGWFNSVEVLWCILKVWIVELRNGFYLNFCHGNSNIFDRLAMLHVHLGCSRVENKSSLTTPCKCSWTLSNLEYQDLAVMAAILHFCSNMTLVINHYLVMRYFVMVTWMIFP